MNHKTIAFLVVPVAFSLATIAPSHADPERAYQGGKAASGAFEGKNKVDDRDIGQRAGQYLKDAGAGNKDSNAFKYDPEYNKPKPDSNSGKTK